MFTIFYVKFISELSTISPFKKAFFFKTNLIRRKNDLQGKPSTVPAVERFFYKVIDCIHLSHFQNLNFAFALFSFELKLVPRF